MVSAQIISFSDAKLRLRPTHTDIDRAIDCWLLACEQSFYCLQCCQAYIDYLDACRLTPEAWVADTLAFWNEEFTRRTQVAEYWLDQRERRKVN